MKALLLRDYYTIRFMIIPIILLSAVFAIATNVVFLYVLSVVFIGATIINDRATNWNAFCQCLPISNKKYVQSKYVLSIISIAVSTPVVVVCKIVSDYKTGLSFFGSDYDFSTYVKLDEILLYDGFFYLAVILAFHSLFLLVMLNIRKGDLTLSIIKFIALVLLGPIVLLIFGTLLIRIFPIGLAIISLAIYIGSYFLVENLYKKRNL